MTLLAVNLRIPSKLQMWHNLTGSSSHSSNPSRSICLTSSSFSFSPSFYFGEGGLDIECSILTTYSSSLAASYTSFTLPLWRKGFAIGRVRSRACSFLLLMKMVNPQPAFRGGRQPIQPFYVDLPVLEGVFKGSQGVGVRGELEEELGLSGDCINHYKVNSIVIFKHMNQLPCHLEKTLSALALAPWQQQVTALQQLKPSPQLAKLISHRNYAADLAALVSAPAPRSQLVIAFADFIASLFSVHSRQLISFANLLVSGDCLLRLLSSGNKTIASTANECLKSIISHSPFGEKSLKFVIALEDEFLQSRSPYVREKISLYFLLIATSGHYRTRQQLLDFEKKVVRVGLEDASEAVRKNMREILENIHHYEKENQMEQMEREGKEERSSRVKSMRSAREKSKSSKVLRDESSLIIQESFRREENGSTSQLQKNNVSNLEEQKEENLQFYLLRLSAESPWAMKQLAIQTLAPMIKNNCLTTFNNDSLFTSTLTHLLPLLSQKRNRTYQTISQLYLIVLLSIQDRPKPLAYIKQHLQEITQQAAKYECVAEKLLPALISLDPSTYITQMSEIALQLKIHKERLSLLDAIVKQLDHWDHSKTKHAKQRVSTIAKVMCQMIEQANPRERDICLAALAIISQLKSRMPDEVLTTLLCQKDKLLTKIIDLAASVEPTLKNAVIAYINSLKSEPKRPQSLSPFDQIQSELRLLTEEKTTSLHKLGELLLVHINELSVSEWRQVLGLLQFLCSNDALLEFRILLGEISRTGNRRFSEAVGEMLREEEEALAEHHEVLLIELLGVSLQSWRGGEDGLLLQLASKLGKIYRSSHSLRKRNAAIEALTHVPISLLGECCNEKEVRLVEQYRRELALEDEQK